MAVHYEVARKNTNVSSAITGRNSYMSIIKCLQFKKAEAPLFHMDKFSIHWWTTTLLKALMQTVGLQSDGMLCLCTAARMIKILIALNINNYCSTLIIQI
jgi:hypothetical protein